MQDPITFSGHVNNSFYVKSSFSPDDRYIVSGSSDYDVYVWDVKHPFLAPLRLKGHIGEVSDIDWCPTDLGKLASSSDDTTVRIWNLGRVSRCEDVTDYEMDGFLGRGTAEAPPSWSMPSSQSEEDALVCLETMLESETWMSTFTNNIFTTQQTSTEHGTSPQLGNESTGLSRFALPRCNSPSKSNSPSSSSPPLKQTTLDDLWQPRGFHRPEARPGRNELVATCSRGILDDAECLSQGSNVRDVIGSADLSSPTRDMSEISERYNRTDPEQNLAIIHDASLATPGQKRLRTMR